MIFGGIQKCSTLDYPGSLSAVLFTVGCNLDCFYCHNRALLKTSCPVLPFNDIDSFLKKRIGLIDAIVISGGEPTLQDGLIEFIKYVRSLGYLVKLDTNGQRPDIVEEAASQKLIDYLAVDLKSLPDDYHWVACGTDNAFENVTKTIHIASKYNISHEVRTTLYPGLTLESLLSIMKSVPALPLYRLNFYKPPEEARADAAFLLTLPALSEAEIEQARPVLEEAQPNIIW